MINLSNCPFRGWHVLLVLLGMNAGGGLLVGADDLSRAAVAAPAVAGSWSVTDPMEYERYWFTATRLLNGRVLVTGGYSYESYDLDTAELFDGRTGHWRETGRMRAARYSHKATLLADGRVLVAAGYNGAEMSSAEIYNPATGPTTPPIRKNSPSCGKTFRLSTEILPSHRFRRWLFTTTLRSL